MRSLQNLCTVPFPTQQEPSRKRLGEILVSEGALSDDELRIALLEQRTTSKIMLGEILVRLGFIDHDILAEALALCAGARAITDELLVPDLDLIARVPLSLLKQHQIMPLHLDGEVLTLAMSDPFDVVAMDAVRRHFKGRVHIEPCVVAQNTLATAIQTLEEQNLPSIAPLLRKLEGDAPLSMSGFGENDQAPVIQLVDMLLADAVQRGASDIHLAPEDHFVRIRLRQDGSLRQIHALHLSHWPALSHRIKIMAGMDIADSRSIQDGRFQQTIDSGTIDFRVAIMPSVQGETIVIRILDHRRSLLPLEQLGYSTQALEKLKLIMQKPQGLTLITGPTGSGKTTTLYALLRELSTTEVHIATLEEPVEYQLELIRQTSIQDHQGLGFAEGVRGLLRMDPDIILIGEIRDAQTAQMALRAAMTGHQVYATLHSKDAMGALPRLVDLGLNPRILAGNVSGIVAQRLVRTLCPDCRSLRTPTQEERRFIGTMDTLAEAHGCALCEGSGRKGRTVIAEVLPVSPAIDALIGADAPPTALLDQARGEGFVSLQEDGLDRLQHNLVALSDLARAVDLTGLAMKG